MKTYLKIQFSSEADPPSKIIDRLEAHAQAQSDFIAHFRAKQGG